MMPQQNSYQSINTFQLKPVYISLGLPKSTFGETAEIITEAPFKAALDGGTQKPDCVWLFRGEDCYLFNVKTGEFEVGPVRMSEQWGGSSWPLVFASGIDCAVWGGPVFPDLVYFFKDNLYIRYNVTLSQVDVAPRPIEQDWGTARGTWLSNGAGTALHSIEIRYRGMTHFFKDSEYLRHNLNNGLKDAGPIPIIEQWQLPELFAKNIDLAFYGTGDEAEKIYFFKGDQYLLYDLKAGKAEKISTIEERFPAMAKYIARPQLFLVENYELNTYVGPSEAGELVETVSIPGRTNKSFILVTEVTETSSSEIQQTLLQSQDDTVQKNFYDQMKKQNESSENREKYDYTFEASFHGDASANSLWGGEVNANLQAKGGTNDVRNSFTEAAFGTIESQLNTTTKQIKQQVYTSDQQYTRTERTMKIEEQTIDNLNSDKLLVYEYHRQRQTYLTLMLLRGIRLAYADHGHTPEIVDISKMDSLMTKHIPSQKDRDEIKQLIVGELTNISDYQGTTRSVLKQVELSVGHDGQLTQTRYQFDPQLKSNYSMTNPDSSEQIIAVDGIVKGSKMCKVPTYTMIVQQIPQS